MARTLKNLLSLHERGFYVEVATPLMTTNFDSRFEIEEYFAGLGIKQSFAWPIVSEYHGGAEKKALLNVSKEQFLQFCLERPDFLLKLDSSGGGEDSICAAGKAVMSISANGDVFSCSQFPKPFGNILSADVGTIYRSPGMREIAALRMADIPADVLPYNFCIGNNYSETGDVFRQPEVVRECLAYYELHAKGAGGQQRCRRALSGFSSAAALQGAAGCGVIFAAPDKRSSSYEPDTVCRFKPHRHRRANFCERQHERAAETAGGDLIEPADPEADRKIAPVWTSTDPAGNTAQGCTKCATRSSSH